MFWIGLFVVALTLGYYYLKNVNKYWIKKGVRQADPMLFFGNGFDTMTGRNSMAESMGNLYENVSKSRYLGLYFLMNPMLQISCPDLLKQITVKDFEHFTDHQSFVPEDDPLFGKFLTLLKGKKWRDVRSVMSPTFTSSKIRYLFGHMQKAADQFIDYFKSNERVEIEMRDTFTRFTSDVIATTVFGAHIDSLKDRNNEFYRMVAEATDLRSLKKTSKIMVHMAWPWLFKVLKLTALGTEVNNYFVNLIKSTIKDREESKIQRPDLMTLLLEARKGTLKADDEKTEVDTGFATVQEHVTSVKKQQRSEITDNDIMGQAMIFFFAGFETVASLMCFVAYELAANPEIQTRLREEINETYATNNGQITYESIVKMRYLDMVVCETLRKWPVNNSTDRCCTKAYTIEPTRADETAVHLKVGDLIWIPIFGLHRDPAYYPEPERFDPERFNEENRKKINPYTYIPFGLGPRNCIASRFALLETKLIISSILRSFELTISPKMKFPLQLNKKGPLLSADGGTWLVLNRLD